MGNKMEADEHYDVSYDKSAHHFDIFSDFLAKKADGR